VSYTNPNQLQLFASNGATEYSDAYEFITGLLQQVITVMYSVTGGSGYSPPIFSYVSNGVQQQTSLTGNKESFPVDFGTEWSISSLLPGSNSNERWITNQQTSGIVTSNTSLSFVYYHQYLISVTYSVSGGSSGSGAPSVSYTSMGSSYNSTISPTAMIWVDAGSSWQVSSLLPGSNSNERWMIEAPTSYIADSPSIYSFMYIHQFYVMLNSNEGGQVNLQSGWYNSSQQITLSASPQTGWQFEEWNGSPYTGPVNTTIIAISSPVTETAVFYPGLSIGISAGGVVSYSYGATSASISSNQTIFLPPGTVVSLSASPSLFIYSFTGWSGAVQSTSSLITVKVNSPTTIIAKFGYNYPVIALLTIAAATIAGLGVYMARRRSGGKQALQSKAEQS
ncbi:MAG: hypothetical protein QXV84_03325, partial [Conexivisphaerales archaeon]